MSRPKWLAVGKHSVNYETRSQLSPSPKQSAKINNFQQSSQSSAKYYTQDECESAFYNVDYNNVDKKQYSDGDFLQVKNDGKGFYSVGGDRQLLKQNSDRVLVGYQQNKQRGFIGNGVVYMKINGKGSEQSDYDKIKEEQQGQRHLPVYLRRNNNLKNMQAMQSSSQYKQSSQKSNEQHKRQFQQQQYRIGLGQFQDQSVIIQEREIYGDDQGRQSNNLMNKSSRLEELSVHESEGCGSQKIECSGQGSEIIQALSFVQHGDDNSEIDNNNKANRKAIDNGDSEGLMDWHQLQYKRENEQEFKQVLNQSHLLSNNYQQEQQLSITISSRPIPNITIEQIEPILFKNVNSRFSYEKNSDSNRVIGSCSRNNSYQNQQQLSQRSNKHRQKINLSRQYHQIDEGGVINVNISANTNFVDKSQKINSTKQNNILMKINNSLKLQNDKKSKLLTKFNYKLKQINQLTNQIKVIKQTISEEIKFSQSGGRMQIFMWDRIKDDKKIIELKEKLLIGIEKRITQTVQKRLQQKLNQQTLINRLRQGKIQQTSSIQNRTTNKNKNKSLSLRADKKTLQLMISPQNDNNDVSKIMMKPSVNRLGQFYLGYQAYQILRQKQQRLAKMAEQLSIAQLQCRSLTAEKQQLQQQLFTKQQRLIGVEMQIQQKVRKQLHQLQISLEQRIRQQLKQQQVNQQQLIMMKPKNNDNNDNNNDNNNNNNNDNDNDNDNNNNNKSSPALCYLQTIDTLTKQIADLTTKCVEYQKYILEQQRYNHHQGQIQIKQRFKITEEMINTKMEDLHSRQQALLQVQKQLIEMEARLKQIEYQLNKQTVIIKQREQELLIKQQQIQKFIQELNKKQEDLYDWEKNIKQQQKSLSERIKYMERQRQKWQRKITEDHRIINQKIQINNIGSNIAQTYHNNNINNNINPKGDSYSSIDSGRVRNNSQLSNYYKDTNNNPIITNKSHQQQIYQQKHSSNNYKPNNKDYLHSKQLKQSQQHNEISTEFKGNNNNCSVSSRQQLIQQILSQRTNQKRSINITSSANNYSNNNKSYNKDQQKHQTLVMNRSIQGNGIFSKSQVYMAFDRNKSPIKSSRPLNINNKNPSNNNFDNKNQHYTNSVIANNIINGVKSDYSIQHYPSSLYNHSISNNTNTDIKRVPLLATSIQTDNNNSHHRHQRLTSNTNYYKNKHNYQKPSKDFSLSIVQPVFNNNNFTSTSQYNHNNNTSKSYNHNNNTSKSYNHNNNTSKSSVYTPKSYSSKILPYSTNNNSKFSLNNNNKKFTQKQPISSSYSQSNTPFTKSTLHPAAYNISEKLQKLKEQIKREVRQLQ